MSNHDHAAAYLTLLAAAPGTPALPIYDGQVPSSPSTPTPPYVVVYFTLTTPDDPSVGIEDVPAWADATAYVHSVGGNAAASRRVADRVRSALLAAQPTVTGRTAARVRHIDSQPPQRDETTLRLVYSQIDVYQFRTLPG